jgi:hypothetical protein
MRSLLAAQCCLLAICISAVRSQQPAPSQRADASAATLAQAATSNPSGQATKKARRESWPSGGKATVGLKPITDMSATDRYKGQDGGLYGGGKNEPPPQHLAAIAKALKRIEPLDATGRPATDGIVGFVSISMSNATMEFSTFKRLADMDSKKSPRVMIVDCAQGGQAMAEWVDPRSRPWLEASRRLAAANVAPKQVQVTWIKLANKGPRGDLMEHGKKLESDTVAVIQNAKAAFPNLRLAYLSSRIYGGYATSRLNPEPYAYESGFVVRWLIQRQMGGDRSLNYDAEFDNVRAPVLLWGPYLWADGITPRKLDGLRYGREDLGADGTHPSPGGREKVARLLLDFYKTDPLAKPWFAR